MAVVPVQKSRMWRLTVWHYFAIPVFVGLLLFSWSAVRVLARAAQGAARWNDLFSQAALRQPVSIAPELATGFAVGTMQPASEMRYLILGKDEVAGSGREEILTDTMIVATYRPADGKVRLLSLPRDIYVPEAKVKVNSLYRQGLTLDPLHPASHVQSVLESILGVRFSGVLELSLSDFESLIDDIGGVDVTVDRSFTDKLFPRSGVDVTKVHDPKLLYETVSFSAGEQHFDGALAMKFIRSRHSTDPQEGNDEARSRRQQKVIEALLARVAKRDLLTQPTMTGQLYRWYADHFQAQVTLFDLGKIAGSARSSGKVPVLEKIVLPVTDAPKATSSAVLFVHPPLEKYAGQWAFEPTDLTWKQLQKFVVENRL